MAARKKQKNINLLPQEEFASTPLGRALAWALSTFRIIVIITEVVVMAAFFSRFWLDARVSDLNDLIRQRRAVIEASSEFEDQFKSAQERLNVLAAMSQEDLTASQTLNTITSYLPNNVTLTSYNYLRHEASVKGITSSERAIAQLIANLESVEEFGEINLTQLGTTEDQSSQLTFTITVNLEGGGS